MIACPNGGAEVAHQIINTGSAPLRYLSLSTLSQTEVCEYPDSNKVGVWSSAPGATGLRKIFLADAEVDYYEGEPEVRTPGQT